MTQSIPDVVSAQGLTGCVLDGCIGELVARGRCRRHYNQWWKATRDSERPAALNLKTKTPDERFWEKAERRGPDECWPWTGSTYKFGHGEFFVSPERGRVPAHSYARELATGERCPAGKEACHHCDNPPCCNPSHIYYGTRQQNVDDMFRRGRAAIGSACPRARLTEADVLAIRVRFAAGETQPALAAEYGIGCGHISFIVNGHMWKHVGGPIRTHDRPGRRFPKKEAA